MKWEYKIMAPPSDCLTHWLNCLGDEGWELCGAQSESWLQSGLGWIFKRDKSRLWNKE